jgi:hypothetical protein
MTRLALALACLFVVPSPSAAPEPDARRAQVAERGRDVMPFDLEATRHHFVRTDDGGIQRVVAHDHLDAKNVSAIRVHMAGIAAAFGSRDFSDPKRIHGDDMPGLTTLERAAPGALAIEYGEIASGAQIRYASRDPAVVEAIHDWFDAQVSDHGHHASAH